MFDKRIVSLLTLLACGAAWGQLYIGQSLNVGQAVPPQAGGGGGAAALFSENFEPSWTNWSRNNSAPFDATINNGWYVKWTTTSGPASTVTNASTSGLSLEGTNCLAMGDPAGDYPTAQSPSFSAQSECWAYLEMRFPSFQAPHFHSVELLDSSTNFLAGVTITAAGNVCAYQGTAQYQSAVITLSTNTTYYFWIHYKASSATNGICSVGVSATASRPTGGNGYAEVTNGDATASAVFVRFNAGYGTAIQYFDKVRVYSGATPPSDNPE